MKKVLFSIIMSLPVSMIAQTKVISTPAVVAPGYWQQKVKYAMDIDVNAAANRFTGKQKLEYWNNSPDTLTRVYYHLYFNAFQPGSMMDVRSRRQGTVVLRTNQDGRNILDWDSRVRDRIQDRKSVV